MPSATSALSPACGFERSQPSPPTGSGNGLRRLIRALIRACVLLLAVGVALSTFVAVRGLFVHGDSTYTDAILLYTALRIRDGLPVYTDVTEPPFLALIYWPLHPLIAGTIARFGDLGPAGTLYVARGIAMLSAVTIAASIFGLARMCGARRAASLCAAALFLTSLVIHPWAYSARGDMLALALCLTGLDVVLRSRTLAGAAVAGVLFALGFASKQTFVVGVTAATLMLLWRRELPRATAIVACWVAVVSLFALTMTTVTDGRFLTQTFGDAVVTFSVWRSIDRLTLFALVSLSAITLTAVGWRGASSTSRTPGVLWLYLILTVVVASVALSRFGSDFNYLLEAKALLCVLAGVGLERVLRRVEASGAQSPIGPLTPRRLRIAALGLLVAVCGLGQPTVILAVKLATSHDDSALVAALRETPGLVLTERDATAAMLAGKEAFVPDPLQLKIMASEGVVDIAPLNDRIRSQAFSTIVLRCLVDEVPMYEDAEWWPPGTRELIREHYRLSHKIPGHALYVPAGPHERAATSSTGIEYRRQTHEACRMPE